MVPPSGIPAELPPASDASVAAERDAVANELISDVTLDFATAHAWRFDAHGREERD
jgi:hypothetical protein